METEKDPLHPATLSHLAGKQNEALVISQHISLWAQLHGQSFGFSSSWGFMDLISALNFHFYSQEQENKSQSKIV